MRALDIFDCALDIYARSGYLCALWIFRRALDIFDCALDISTRSEYFLTRSKHLMRSKSLFSGDI